jgi:hypothetical protein
MKTNFRTLGFLFALVTVSVISPKQASAQQDYVSFQVFYDELSPYGQWVDDARYGYVWIPDAGPDFMPYSTAGQWILTDYGWTWVSNYEWGWAPFHYGRWDYDNYYGWIWVPDYEWGPSWVTWRSASGYYGWQPMRPGISISISFGRDYYNDYHDHWMFVRDRDFQRSNISRYYVNQTNRDRIIMNSTIINNTYIDNSRNTTYVSGPVREDVQRTTGQRVRSVSIRENNTPGQNLKNGQLQIYRPQVRNNNNEGRKPAPNRVTSREEVKQPSERKTINQPRNVSPSNDNRQERPLNNERQPTENRIKQPAQQQKANPSENKRLERQQKEVTRPNKNIIQPSQRQNANPSETKKREQRQPQASPANNNKAQPAHQQNANPSENKKREQRQPEATPANNNKAQPAQQQNVKPTNNNQQERPAKAVKAQNTKKKRQQKGPEEKGNKK